MRVGLEIIYSAGKGVNLSRNTLQMKSISIVLVLLLVAAALGLKMTV
jgi:hypothetical protein